MKTYIFKYAVAGALISILFGLLNWIFIAPNFSVSTSQAIGYLAIVLSLLCIPMGIKHFRDIHNDGKVSFGQGFKIGISITFIASVVLFFYGMLFHMIEGEKFAEWQFKDLKGEELAKMEAQIASLPDYFMDPWFQGFILFLIIFSIGFAITLLSAFLLKYSGSGK